MLRKTDPTGRVTTVQCSYVKLRWEDPDGSDPESELLVDHIQKPRLDGVTEKLHRVSLAFPTLPVGNFLSLNNHVDVQLRVK